jgi:hypothetical protein
LSNKATFFWPALLSKESKEFAERKEVMSVKVDFSNLIDDLVASTNLTKASFLYFN